MTPTASSSAKVPLLRRLYIQVLIGILVGVALGHFYPTVGADMKPLGDGFIKLIKMLLAPVIFGTIVVGIARMGDLKEVGKVGAKALLYFEVLSTIALVVGLLVVNILKPGVGMNVDAATLDGKAISAYTSAAETQHAGAVDFIMNVIPRTIVGSFADGNVLQIIFFAVLLGAALSKMGPRAKPFIDMIDLFLNGLFGIVKMVMVLAPIGAFGAIAFTIGKYGVGSLASYGKLIIAVYGTCVLFIVVVLGTVARICRISIFSYLRYIRDELLITFGTASTESVLPQMMSKLERAGCEKTVVGMVLPAGYTFNPDGTAIYLTIGAIFVAQATNTELSWMQQLVILGVLMLTSKGSAGVAGAGFVTLAATLGSMHSIPVAGLVLLLGVDRFLNEARAITNLVGNGLATIAVAKWERAFDEVRWREVTGDKTPLPKKTRTPKAPRVAADSAAGAITPEPTA
ncbi:dicarboxylate/amino acid:cation symporter [Variovorax sp. J22R133]|uniref:dicarboxylate/amino acid:cation symporter n=1 Tax=Variovorax brevis TaxID=3053503 RepID=UPI00257892A2|nr:dicarboxylate/amino acid:cation symporter [Variovorax sp. J22R133]MDM0114771.1 dicarboxylate/amino acid:cation symporter [Variovorax sp. J22R133]